MRILFLAVQPPLPLDNGGRLRTFHLLEQLSARAQVALVCLDREPGSGLPPIGASEISDALPDLNRVASVPAPAGRKRLRQLTALAGRSSYTLAMHRSPALERATRDLTLEFEPDLIHCDSEFAAWVRPRHPQSGPWVLAPHNHESKLKAQLADTAAEWPRRLAYRNEAQALAALERKYAAKFEHWLAVSEREAGEFRALGAASVAVAPNGVDPMPPPAAPTPLAQGEPLRLLFVGSLNYEPNRDGLEWFVEEVAPVVRERVPIDIEVVGPGRRGPELPGVRYLGRVDDLDSAYERAHAAVVPLRVGAGSRLKVLEALARGVPLVSTSVGAEGFDLVDGEHALIADEPATLAERLALLQASLQGHGGLAQSLVTAAYDFASDYFWPGIGERLAAQYGEWAEPSDDQRRGA
ncbi:MAG TPA: glycosyltransferase [Solirubrobacteraceae bacterium]